MLVGPDDGHMKECKDLVNNLGINNQVLFTGFLGGEHKNSALVDAEIVVQLSRFEQGAWAPLEGVLCKTPIIVTADTGTGEDVKRLNAGYLVDFDNNEMLAQTIIDILNDYEDAKKLTLTARDFIIENLNPTIYTKSTFTVYNRWGVIVYISADYGLNQEWWNGKTTHYCTTGCRSNIAITIDLATTWEVV